MKYNITEPIKDYKNNDILVDGKTFSWRDVCYTALNNFADDEKLSLEDKQECFNITVTIFKDEKIDLTAKQVEFLLKRITKIYGSPLICGRADEFFNKKN